MRSVRGLFRSMSNQAFHFELVSRREITDGRAMRRLLALPELRVCGTEAQFQEWPDCSMMLYLLGSLSRIFGISLAPKCAAVVVGLGANVTSLTKDVIDIMLESITRVVLLSSLSSVCWLVVGCLLCVFMHRQNPCGKACAAGTLQHCIRKASKLSSCKTTLGLLLTHPDILCGSGVLLLWGMCAILAAGAIALSVTLSRGPLLAR